VVRHWLAQGFVRHDEASTRCAASGDGSSNVKAKL